MLNKERKEEIANRLNERIGRFECPMCHKGPFSIIDGYVQANIQSNLSSYSLGGASIPMIAIACNNCGYISFHALGALGLLDTQKREYSEPSLKESDNNDNR